MPAIKQPVNPDVLTWALKQAGVTRGELALALAVPDDVVDDWLSGEDAPGMTQLRGIAKLLRRPTSFFFLPRVPQRPAVEASFRHPWGKKGARTLTSEEVAELRSAQRRQRIAKWAFQALEEATPPQLPNRAPSPTKTAGAVQQWLHWDVKWQVSATSKGALTRLLRRALEDQGILVLQRSMDETSCRGFSIYDPEVPVIAFNGSQFPAARTFTLLHELGHLLAHEQAVCGSPEPAEERWCDEFAAAFLLPESHLGDYLRFKKVDHVESDDIDMVRLIAQRYKVSFQCVALRLIDLERADWSLYEKVRNNPLEYEKGGFGGAPQTTPVRRIREYGTTYPRLVLAACDKGSLADIDARKYLNVDGKQLTALRRSILMEEV
ncbi:ImmA/IrrE family metallo-endopeptidase [Streptomyces sp. NBC_01217]|uniref:ImmA/IrrE family metallo-endopeptidase n=1 Tax=Streptomyces sp. NBC_01217 TaxID=2903779 RepID=UPI002E132481|nr:ImmA/IrrE family metallo-endopeptidase [Streptomyces sp. NBC_01217]